VPDRPTDRAAKLVLFERRAGRIEVTPCIQRGIAEELKGAAMKRVASRFADDRDYAAIVVPILGIEVAGQHPELFDRIQVGNDRCPAVHGLLNIDSVHHEAIRGLPLPVDR